MLSDQLKDTTSPHKPCLSEGRKKLAQKLNINNVQWKMHMCLLWECEVMSPFLKQNELQVKRVH